MSEATLLWIFGAIVTLQTTVIGGIVAALWVHVGHCKIVAASMARVEATVERICQDIGTHDTGLRGEVHRIVNRLIEHEGRLGTLERRQETQR